MPNLKTISPEYLDLNKEMHRGNFGGGGYKKIPHILPLIKEFNVKTILDYGCGQGTLAEGLNNARAMGKTSFDVVYNYDPARREYSRRPKGQFDLVCCTDVLEHIEPEYLQNTLQDIYQYTRKAAYLFIACHKANKVLPDGRNAHLIQEPPDWWIEQLRTLKWIPAGYVGHEDKEHAARVKKFMVTMKKVD